MRILWVVLAAAGLLWGAPARAQAPNVKVVSTCAAASLPIGFSFLQEDQTGAACVNAAVSVSASITGFNPTSTGTPISVTTGGVTGSLPAGTVVIATNVGTTNVAYCKLGASSTTSDQAIPPGGWFAFTVAASTQLTCITSTSTTTVNMVGGTGLPTGTGGGGGGSSSSNASVSATGSAVPASATYVGITSAGTLTGWTGAVSQSGTWNITNVSGTISLPTGAATAANQVPTPSVNNGTTDAGTQRVTLSSDGTGQVKLATGSNIAGRVGVDQTTPGTTNAVSLGCAGATIANTKTAPFSNAGSATSLNLVAKQTGQNVYICALNIGPVAGAINVAIVSGTKVTTECDTGAAGLFGGATAATGKQIAANGGITYGNGSSVIGQTASTGKDVCALFSGTAQTDGTITYAQY